jgi:hypothetical protein
MKKGNKSGATSWNPCGTILRKSLEYWLSSASSQQSGDFPVGRRPGTSKNKKQEYYLLAIVANKRVNVELTEILPAMKKRQLDEK